jgi:hypothetical protein
VGSAASGSGALQRPVASLKPGSAPQKATLLTENGPLDVRKLLAFLLIIYYNRKTILFF